LRTPLNSIIGFTGIVLKGLAGPLTPEQSKQLDMVRASARHLLNLINDVLDISKIEAGELTVRCEPVDLHASIAKAVGIVKPLAERKGLALRVDVPLDLGQTLSDERRVQQVLLNLLTNAVKFTEQGEVALTVEAASDAVHMRVADTGIGIKPEDLAIVFQPFRQVDSGTTRHHEGTGLGLAICRRLADLMGGEIRAASEWGKGSVFTFTLPVKAQGKYERENPVDRRQ
jgi:signal transduction histidine kinase